MAIVILQRGVIPEQEQEFVTTCRYCKSKLKFLSGDAQRKYHAGYQQREPDYYTYTIACPICKASVSVTSNK